MAVSETFSVIVAPSEVALLEALELLDLAEGGGDAKYASPCSLDADHVQALVNYIKDGNEALAAFQSQAAGRIRMLEDALRQAVKVITTWHNMGGADDVWDIYYRNAPEMKAIRDILGVRP